MENSGNGNLDKLTPHARRTLMLAGREAVRLNHDRVGSAHLLLGMLALNEGVALETLKSLGLNLQRLRIELEKISGCGGNTQTRGALDFSPRVIRIIDMAAREAQSMNYNFIGTEHLLLALLRDGEGKAAQLLKNLGITPEQVRKAVIRNLDSDYLPDNGELYCSELVYEAYLDSNGNHLFESKPMNFRDKAAACPNTGKSTSAASASPFPKVFPAPTLPTSPNPRCWRG